MNIDINYIDSLVDIALAGLAIYQNKHHHKEKKSTDHKLHEEELHAGRSEFSEEEKQQRQTHLLNVLSELERHFQQLNSDLISQTRESERDSWDQRSQQLQTMTVAATIMLTALINVLTQGVFNHHTSNFVNMCYSLSNAASLALLVISVVLCTEIISKASSYMYQRSRKFNKAVRNALSSTRAMMSNVRGTRIAGSSYDDITSPISHADDDMIDDKWNMHEGKVSQFMSNRDHIHDTLSTVLLGSRIDTDAVARDFATYWELHWKRKADAAIMSFYLGTFFMICANVIFMWEFWHSTYDSVEGGVIAIVILFFSGIIALLIFLRMRYIDITCWKYCHSSSYHRHYTLDEGESERNQDTADELHIPTDTTDSPSIIELQATNNSLLRRSMQSHQPLFTRTTSATLPQIIEEDPDFIDERGTGLAFDGDYDVTDRPFVQVNPLPVVGSRATPIHHQHPLRIPSADFAPDDEMMSPSSQHDHASDRRRYRAPTAQAIRIHELETDAHPPKVEGYWSSRSFYNSKRHHN